MGRKTIIVSVTAIVGVLFATPALARGTDGSGNHRQECDTFVSDSGNVTSRCAASTDPYVPNVDAATQRDLKIAKNLYKETQAWCRANSTKAELRQNGYRPHHSGATHWTLGWEPLKGRFVPGKPKMAMWVDGRLVGAAYTAKDGFPYLGTIPRPHKHHHGKVQMLHVWCVEDLKGAYVTRGPHLPEWDGHYWASHNVNYTTVGSSGKTSGKSTGKDDGTAAKVATRQDGRDGRDRSIKGQGNTSTQTDSPEKRADRLLARAEELERRAAKLRELAAQLRH